MELVPSNHPGIEFGSRSVNAGTGEVGGLIELIDNNPLVCADHCWVPSPAGTLALLALGPISEAGLLIEAPAVLTSFPDAQQSVIETELASANWTGGIMLQSENHDLGSVRGVYVVAKIRNPDNFDDLDEIYRERYARSFFVRERRDNEWNKELVADTPFASYYLELSPGEIESLLSIHVMADINGKLGAAQYVHMMNVMCGFEESLGIL
ncbi:MAG: hypothetical protein WCK51_13000 [Armatimonadota bacterium]